MGGKGPVERGVEADCGARLRDGKSQPAHCKKRLLRLRHRNEALWLC